jgi:large subunit ribosomal protein L22
MQAIAKAQYVRTGPLKARIVADAVRGKRVKEALAILQFTPNRAARLIEKVVKSAAANAENNNRMNADKLFISMIMVDDGPRWKRLRSAPQGRVYRMVKRTAHITVGVDEGDFEVVKPGGGKGVARPGLAARPTKKVAPATVPAAKTKDAEVKLDKQPAVESAEEQVVVDAVEVVESPVEATQEEVQPEENK